MTEALEKPWYIHNEGGVWSQAVQVSSCKKLCGPGVESCEIYFAENGESPQETQS